MQSRVQVVQTRATGSAPEGLKGCCSLARHAEPSRAESGCTCGLRRWCISRYARHHACCAGSGPAASRLTIAQESISHNGAWLHTREGLQRSGPGPVQATWVALLVARTARAEQPGVNTAPLRTGNAQLLLDYEDFTPPAAPRCLCRTATAGPGQAGPGRARLTPPLRSAPPSGVTCTVRK